MSAHPHPPPESPRSPMRLLITSDTPDHGSNAPATTERWHKFPDFLIDNLIMANLSAGGIKLLCVFLRLRTRPDCTQCSTVHAPVELLCKLSGLKAPSLHRPKAELLSHRDGLLAARADLGDHWYEVLPRTAFAGRRADCKSAELDRSKATAGCKIAVERKGSARTQGIEIDKDDDKSDVVRKLMNCRARFTESDARRLASMASGPEIDALIRQAEEKARQRTFRLAPDRSVDACMRAWIADGIRRGWGRDVADQQNRSDAHRDGARERLADQQARELASRMARVMRHEDARAVLATFGSWQEALNAGVLTERWSNRSDLEIRNWLLNAVGAATAGKVQAPSGPAVQGSASEIGMMALCRR